jgi:hypothetical protein
MDRCNAHVGRGYDYHYHGDPYGTAAKPCVYSASDYATVTSHPPFLGWYDVLVDRIGLWMDIVGTEDIYQNQLLDILPLSMIVEVILMEITDTIITVKC